MVCKRKCITLRLPCVELTGDLVVINIFIFFFFLCGGFGDILAAFAFVVLTQPDSIKLLIISLVRFGRAV